MCTININYEKVKKPKAPTLINIATDFAENEDLTDVAEDVCFVQNLEEFNVKSVTSVSDKSLINYVNINLQNGSSKLIRKSSILWAMTNSSTPLSNDRLVKFKTKISSDSNIDKSSLKDFIFVGDLISFLDINGELSIGQVLHFEYLTGKNKNHSLNYCPLKTPANVKSRGVGCFCVIFEPNEL